MAGWVKRALTRRIRTRRGVVEEPPSEALELAMKFCIVATLALTGLEVAHMALLHSFNQSIFGAIQLIIGAIVGIIVGRRV